jgi:hypothetical protein
VQVEGQIDHVGRIYSLKKMGKARDREREHTKQTDKSGLVSSGLLIVPNRS